MATTSKKAGAAGLALEPWLALIIMCVAVIIFFARVLFRRFIIPWDFRGFHLPLAAAVFDAMKNGRSVLWDPSTYCGRPLFADPQAQVFYPPTGLAVFLATFFNFSKLVRVLEWELALHVFAAGAFTFLLLRRLGASTVAALCGGLVFELGGFFASQTQHVGAVETVTWMPLMWAAVWELRKGLVKTWFSMLAIAGALAILAGMPAMASTAITSSLILLLLLLATGEAQIRGVVIVVAAIFAAVGLSAIMLLPAIQLTLLSVAKYRTDWFDGRGFPPNILLSLIWPPEHEKVCDLIYCGESGLFLALLAVFKKQSRRSILPFLCLTVLSSIWMLGTGAIYGRVIWALLPKLVKGSLYPYCAMAPVCLGIAVLSGLGLDAIRRLSNVYKYGIALLVAGDLIIAGSGRPMNATDLRKEPGITREQIDGSRATLARLRELTGGTPPSRIDTHGATALLSTTAPLTQIPIANGYNPLVLERLIQARLAFAKGYRWGAWYEVENPESPVVDALNIRYLLTPKPIPTVGNGKTKYALVDRLPGFLVYENLSVLPRFWLVHHVEPVHSSREAFERVHQSDFEPSQVAVVTTGDSGAVEGLVGAKIMHSGEGLSSNDQVATVRYTGPEVTLQLSAAAPGFLASSEVSYPGWRAYLDGSEVPIYVTDGAFRGVNVPAGSHVVSFRFVPRIVWWGAGISAGFLLALSWISMRAGVN